MSSQSKDSRTSTSGKSALGVIVSEMRAPVRFRRKALAVAGAFVCGIRDGSLQCWGIARDGTITVADPDANAGSCIDAVAHPVSHAQ